MTLGEIIYLAGVIGAFAAFAVVLATVEFTEKCKLRRRLGRVQVRPSNFGNALPA